MTISFSTSWWYVDSIGIGGQHLIEKYCRRPSHFLRQRLATLGSWVNKVINCSPRQLPQSQSLCFSCFHTTRIATAMTLRTAVCIYHCLHLSQRSLGCRTEKHSHRHSPWRRRRHRSSQVSLGTRKYWASQKRTPACRHPDSTGCGGTPQPDQTICWGYANQNRQW